MHTLRYILLMTTALLAVACSSDSTLSDEHTVDLRQPMRFGLSTSATGAEVTRAAALESQYTTFKVGAWKDYGRSTQQNVMDGYEVDYTSTARTDAPENYNWYYEGIKPTGKTTEQILRYWDLSAFPYEFRAVAPYLTGTSITETNISINAESTPFRAQQILKTGEERRKLRDGDNNVYGYYNYNVDESEPCLVAHVARQNEGTDYKDIDKIKSQEINTEGKANATREVHLPFHHLMSRIGFRIFIDNPMPVNENWKDDYTVSIQSIKITAFTVDDKFITKSTAYTAESATQNLGIGTFSGFTYHNGAADKVTGRKEYTLFEHGFYSIDTDSHYNFHEHLNRQSAFDLTPHYLQQIPQEKVKIRVQLKMKTHHVEAEDVEFTFDSILRLETLNETDIAPTPGDTFTWEPEKRYIYYLHIKNLHGHEILLHTCEILPWDDVQTTDIDVRL